MHVAAWLLKTFGDGGSKPLIHLVATPLPRTTSWREHPCMSLWRTPAPAVALRPTAHTVVRISSRSESAFPLRQNDLAHRPRFIPDSSARRRESRASAFARRKALDSRLRGNDVEWAGSAFFV